MSEYDEILKIIICRLYGFETCGGDWMPECEDSTASECKSCCIGKTVLTQLESAIKRLKGE